MNIAQAKARVSVEEVVGTRVELQRHGAVLVGPCPLHDDRGRPNLVVFAKTQTWLCFACGAQGDVIDFVTRVERVSVREAIELVGRGVVAPPKVAVRLPVPREVAASLDVRSAAYLTLIEQERLSPRHRDQLLARGFTLAEIEKHQYRTHSPGLGPKRVDLRGVPGFFLDGMTWRVGGPSGPLIPVRDRAGRIVGCQIRPDDPRRGKYLWLSSVGKPGGASSGAPCHYAHAEGDQLWITEGALKADFVADRLGQPYLGVAGVANWRSAMPRLGDSKEVILAFDQDPPRGARETVGHTVRTFAQVLAENGVTVYQAMWDGSTAKGVDDALHADVCISVACGPIRLTH